MHMANLNIILSSKRITEVLISSMDVQADLPLCYSRYKIRFSRDEAQYVLFRKMLSVTYNQMDYRLIISWKQSL